AIDDRYFCSVVGPTFPNRSYEMAATSFGHLTTCEIFPPPGGYKPITGTIFDLLDQKGINWVNYFSDQPTSGIFRPFLSSHLAPVSAFFSQRSEEHTSELQSRSDLVCRLLLEKKKQK